MKLKLTSLFLALTILFTGCKKDDEDEVVVDPFTLLTGTWVLSSQTASACTDSDINGSKFECTECPGLTINSDSTYKYISDTTTEVGTVVLTSTTVTRCVTGKPASECAELTYSVYDKVLTLSGSDVVWGWGDDSVLGCTLRSTYNKK